MSEFCRPCHIAMFGTAEGCLKAEKGTFENVLCETAPKQGGGWLHTPGWVVVDENGEPVERVMGADFGLGSPDLSIHKVSHMAIESNKVKDLEKRVLSLAQMVGDLAVELTKARDVLEEYAPSAPGHFCAPDNNCDCECVEYANHVAWMHGIDRLLKESWSLVQK